MKKNPSNADEPRPEYEFKGGVRGKYAARFAKGSNVVVLEPDVAAQFGSPAAVNDALRAYLLQKKPGGGAV
jgi:hypothetical protein